MKREWQIPGRKRRPHPSPRGFTLIELLTSAVLSMVMMTVATGVVWSSVRELRQIRFADWASSEGMMQQIRLDFQNARGMEVFPRGVQLHGFLGGEGIAGTGGLTAARVRYEIQSIGGRDALVRSSGDSRQVVWIGIGQWIVQPLDSQGDRASSVRVPEAGGLREIPGRFRLTLIDPRGRLIRREVFYHHET